MGDAQASQDQQQGGQRRGSTYFSSFLSKIFLLLPNHLLIENNQSAASGSTEESVVDSGESSSPSSYHFHRIIFVTFNPCYHHQLYTYVMSFSTVSVLVGFVLPFLAVQDSSISDIVGRSLGRSQLTIRA